MKITNLKGVGEKTAEYFRKLGVETIEDLLRFYPRDYERFSDPSLISVAREKNFAAISGTVMENPIVTKKGKLTIVSCYVCDEVGSKLKLTWFNMPYITNSILRGRSYIFRGKINRNGKFVSLEQPRIYTKDKYEALKKTLQPVYRLTKGLTNKMVTSAMEQAMFFANKINDYIPFEISKKYGLISQAEAIKAMHFPENYDDFLEARKRIAFEEMFLFILTLKQNKEDAKVLSTFNIKASPETDKVIKNLGFELTDSQMNTFNEIRSDFEKGYVMSRLLQGDVGSGKTIIAILAMLEAAFSGYQSALMVPTEVLAVQHYKTITELFKENNIDFKVELLTGSMNITARRDAYERIKNGEAKIIIGTHALFQEKVEYESLALVITDEQHRFGVKQREALANKGNSPHILVMSATPIPRTLAMILYGDMEVSIINQVPKERLPIKNCVVKKSYRPNAYRFISGEVAKGHQVYIICPMVEYTEGLDAENVVDYSNRLKEILPSNIKIEYLHGQMSSDKKNDIMDLYARGEIDVLVSTTVIEVGVNVKNATVIMIEDAQRFGLASLHQLRGRVGRGSLQSYCIMIDTNDSENIDERLDVLNKSNDGFFIANEDLKLRGPGDILGVRQSGDMKFSVADIYNDSAILMKASEAVEDYLLGKYNVTPNEEKEINDRCKKCYFAV